MEPQTVVNIGAGAVLMIAGWLFRELWAAVKALQADIRKIEIDLPTTYIRRDEFSDNMKEIKDMLAKIFDKLENKADK